jgi:hypothetical protein
MLFKTFEQIIEEEKIPNHSLKLELKPGVVVVPPDILPAFKQLYRPHGTTKNVGNGEVAFFWLFNKKYGGLYEVERKGRRGSADVAVNSIPVELKGWAQNVFSGQRIKIGRFERQHEIRRIINIVFGAYNVFYAGKYSGEKHGDLSYLSESSFGIRGLARAFDCALKIKDVEFGRLNNVKEAMSHPMYMGLTEPVDFAAITFATLAKEKLLKKIGSNNFIANVRPDIMGRIEVFQLGDLDNINLEKIKQEGARVQCSELFLDLTAFGNNNGTFMEKVF